MVFSVTVWIATQAIFGEKMWLLDSDFQGGPGAYWETNISDWYMDWGTTAVILLQLMTDSLMVGHGRERQNMCSLGWFQIYRCRIIWNSYRAIIVPIILWLSTFGKYHSHITPLWLLHAISTSSLGGPRRLDQQFTRGQLFRWCRFSTRSRILHYLRVSEHHFDVHDMLSYAATWEKGPGTTRAGIRVFILCRRHAHCRVCATVHALWHCFFGVVGRGESDIGGIYFCVHPNDGAWSCQLSCP